MVAKGLLDTLRAVGDSDEQTSLVLSSMVKLSEDSGELIFIRLNVISRFTRQTLIN